MFLCFFFCTKLIPVDSWWLNNTGEIACGLIGEDINYTGFDYEVLNGKGVTINAMADGANLNHTIYNGRGVTSEFLDGFMNVPIENVPGNRSLNVIGQKSLGLAAGNWMNITYTEKKGNLTVNTTVGFGGVAPGANVASYYFYDVTGRNESLQYLVCHHIDNWDVALITYLHVKCIGRECRYIRPNEMTQNMISKCLYDPTDNNPENIRHFVVPAQSKTTDIFFTPPSRWPLVFSIAAVSNRGLPINRGCEGTGLFMSCPGTRDASDTPPAKIPSSIPFDNNSFYQAFDESNASAAIFAGSLAILIESNRNLTLADHFFILAMTATRVNPRSPNWRKNNFGLSFNRRCGFGRLNLGKAIHLAQKWKSVGQFLIKSSKLINNNLRLKGNEKIEFCVDGFPDNSHIIEVVLSMNFKDLGFGSLVVDLISPAGTVSELKVLTEWSELNSDIEDIELPCYQLMGEKINGNWSVSFNESDMADRGLLVHSQLTFYYVNSSIDPKNIDQVNGSDPYSPLPNEGNVTFVNESVVAYAGKNFSASIKVTEEFKKCYVLGYLESRGQRLKLHPKIVDDNKTVIIDYMPSVFANNTEMNLTLESFDENCSFTSSLKLKYINEDPTPRFTQPESHLSCGQTDLRIQWVLNLTEIVDDGYSSSAVISIISIDSKQVLNRVFTRNTGDSEDVYKNIIPKNRAFILQLSPTSQARNDSFKPINMTVYVDDWNGNDDGYVSPFTKGYFAAICIVFIINFIVVAVRVFALIRRKLMPDEVPLNEQVAEE